MVSVKQTPISMKMTSRRFFMPRKSASEPKTGANTAMQAVAIEVPVAQVASPARPVAATVSVK